MVYEDLQELCSAKITFYHPGVSGGPKYQSVQAVPCSRGLQDAQNTSRVNVCIDAIDKVSDTATVSLLTQARREELQFVGQDAQDFDNISANGCWGGLIPSAVLLVLLFLLWSWESMLSCPRKLFGTLVR